MRPSRIQRPRSSIGSVAHRGVTLTEMLIAAALATIVVLSLTEFDVARFRMGEEIRRHSGTLTPEHGRAAFTVIHLAKRLERADRLDLQPDGPNQVLNIRTPNFTTPGCAGVLIPPASCLDLAANYRWEQYNLSPTGELRVYTPPGCASWVVLASQITSLNFFYRDETPTPPAPAPTPPGGEPPVQDNNIMEFRIGWSDGAGISHDFVGQMTIRAGAYTNVMTGLQPPGGADISPPPATCP